MSTYSNHSNKPKLGENPQHIKLDLKLFANGWFVPHNKAGLFPTMRTACILRGKDGSKLANLLFEHMTDSKAGAGNTQISLENPVVPESRKVLKDQKDGACRRDAGAPT